MRRKGGDDEAAESAVELVGGSAEKFGIGADDVFVGGFAVQDVTVLPIGETIWIGHLRFTEAHGFRERADGAFAALGKRSGVRVLDCVRVRATVSGAHDDAFFTGEFATKMVKREGGFYFSHVSNKLGSQYCVLSTKAA